MSRLMDPVEQAIVLECLRQVRLELGFKTSDALANELAQSADEIGIARDCILRRSIAEEARAKFAEAALSIMLETTHRDNYEKIKTYYEKKKSNAAQYVADIMFNCRDIDVANRSPIIRRDRKAPRHIDIIAQNWDVAPRNGRKLLQTGIYQMYRRYKSPPNDEMPDVMDHVVVSELIYVDWDRMECVGVTSEGNIYHGALSINHENILVGVLQRRTDQDGINRRFIALRLVHRRLPMYSGLCIKTGDTTRRPLASECFYVPVPLGDHGPLYSEFDPIVKKPWGGESIKPVEKDSIIYQYLTEHPPLTAYSEGDPTWARVKFLRDFPQIKDLIVPNKEGLTLFQEPSRTLSFDTLRRLSLRKAVLPVFRWM